MTSNDPLRRQRNTTTLTSTQRSKTNSPSPHLVIFDDSVGRRIGAKRLSRKASDNNLSHEGRRVAQVCEDIVQNKSKLSTATSVIAHVGINNLKDSAAELKSKFDKLSDVLIANTNEQCEVVISSIIKRKDELATKVDSAYQKSSGTFVIRITGLTSINMISRN